jgi:phage-related protein
MNEVQNRVIDKVNSSWGWGHDFMQNLANGIDSLYWSANNIVHDAMNEVQNRIMDKVNSSWGWGRDLMQNLVNGINWMYWDVVNAAADVANAISEYLHFSVPDKGPLASFEEWMPDFMEGLAKGIRQNQKVVERAVKGVADAMTLTLDSDLDYTFNASSALLLGETQPAAVVNNYYSTDNSKTIHQTNNSPKAQSRLEIYRLTRNALNV